MKPQVHFTITALLAISASLIFSTAAHAIEACTVSRYPPSVDVSAPWVIDPDEYSEGDPSALAAGRATSATISVPSYYTVSGDIYKWRADFGSSPGDFEITHPTSVEGAVSGPNLPSPLVLPLQFSEWDVKAELGLTWFYKAGPLGPECYVREVQKKIISIVPRVSFMTGFPRSEIWNENSRHKMRDASFRFLRRYCVKGLSVRFTSRGKSRTFGSNTDCEFKNRRRALKGPGGSTVWIADAGTISVAMLQKRRGTRKMTFTVRMGNDVEHRGTIVTRTRFDRGKKGRRIYDTDFDNYINICLNEEYDLYANGGRLYCWIPGRRSKWYSTVSIKRTD